MPRPAKRRLTHFLCIPLLNESSRVALHGAHERIKAELLSSLGSASSTGTGTDTLSTETMNLSIRPLGTWHLTLGVMSLEEPRRIEEAVQELHRLPLTKMLANVWERESTSMHDDQPEDTRTTDGKALRMSLRGLSTMHDPTSTSMLYVQPYDPTNRLQRFCEAVRAAFIEKGLIQLENRRLILHLTVLNSVYAPWARATAGPDAGTAGAGVEVEETKLPGEPTRESMRELNAMEKERSTRLDTKRGVLDAAKSLDTRQRNSRLKGRKQPQRFDATKLLDRMKAIEWTSAIQLDRLAICEMGAQKVYDAEGAVVDEEYKEIAVELLVH